jgi:hypothetical protein
MHNITRCGLLKTKTNILKTCVGSQMCEAALELCKKNMDWKRGGMADTLGVSAIQFNSDCTGNVCVFITRVQGMCVNTLSSVLREQMSTIGSLLLCTRGKESADQEFSHLCH